MTLLLLVIVCMLKSVFSTNVSVDLCNKTGMTGYQSYTTTKSDICDCDNHPYCIRKCCQFGYIYQRIEDHKNDNFTSVCFKNSNQSATGSFSVPLFVGTVQKLTENKFIIGILQCNNPANFQHFRMNNSDPRETYYIQTNGSLYYPESIYKMYSPERFCVDEEDGLSVYLCYTPEDPHIVLGRYISAYSMIISMPFLLLTFLAYLILPESNIHRKSLMCYVLTLLTGYIFLVAIQLNESFIPTGWCHFLGYSIVYFFLASFFWMNVMCIDMWLAFSGMRGFKGKKSTERKRFLAYFAYAMGMPFSLLLIVFLLNTYAHENSIFHPHLGESRCFLEDGYPNLFYFYLPMAIIIGINIVLFILTAVRIQKVKKETSVLKHGDSKRHSYEEEKQKFNLYLKLLFAMGINWIMEVISWAVEWKLKVVPTWIWYLTDFANAAYGVFIFFIFVFKRKIWITVKKRYYVFIGKPHLAHALTSQPGRTSTTNYSTTDTALGNDTRLSELKNARPEERPLNRN